MAKRRKIVAWEVTWQNSEWCTKSGGGTWEHWRNRRDVRTTKRDAASVPRRQICEQRNIRLRPLTYADED